MRCLFARINKFWESHLSLSNMVSDLFRRLNKIYEKIRAGGSRSFYRTAPWCASCHPSRGWNFSTALHKSRRGKRSGFRSSDKITHFSERKKAKGSVCIFLPKRRAVKSNGSCRFLPLLPLASPPTKPDSTHAIAECNTNTYSSTAAHAPRSSPIGSHHAALARLLFVFTLRSDTTAPPSQHL